MSSEDVTMYHNPKCSKSRETLARLRERGIEPRIIEYLDTPPSADEIATLAGILGLPLRKLVRDKEYRELGLPENADDPTLRSLMAENPRVIQRPIVLCGGRGVIARPPECVDEILS